MSAAEDRMHDSARYPMERLPFTLPDFTRLSWVSDEVRAIWESRLGRISNAFQEIEWRAVEKGIRRCALTVVTPEAFVERAADWARAGLTGLPLEVQGLANYYASTRVTPEFGSPFGFRIVIGKSADIVAFKEAYDDADDTRIGQMLGFPACCQKFFDDVWVDAHMVDTTWPMSVNSVADPSAENVIDVDGPLEANILWRWMGVRAVPHLPCSFECEDSIAFGQQLIAVGRECGYEEEMDWMLEILSWPSEWSALHGIAEVKTPILKISTRTDATSCKYTVRRTGSDYPADAIKGLGFPYQNPKKRLLTKSKHYQHGLDNPITVAAPKPTWYATDNGFSSIISMDAAHRPIVDAAKTALARGGNVLDLGCGNGALLAKIVGESDQDAVAYGIDNGAERIAHAKKLMPDATERLWTGDLFDEERVWLEDRRYALVLLMPGRLTETDPERAARLRERLMARCDNLLLYAYGDWLTRFNDLAGLAKETGFELIDPSAGQPVGFAKLA